MRAHRNFCVIGFIPTTCIGSAGFGNNGSSTDELLEATVKQFTYTITDPLGIHARPAGAIAAEAK